MACCVFVMSVIAQIFLLRRRLRAALGLSVAEWGEEETGPGILEGVALRLRGLLRQPAIRALIVLGMSVEIAFAVTAIPGHHGFIEEHRRHLRQAWEYVQAFGTDIDSSALWCTSTGRAGAARTSPP